MPAPTLATQWHATTPESLKAYKIAPNATDDRGPVRSPYTLHGPRKSYFLVRNDVNPAMLFSVNLASFLKSGKVAGFSWFTDGDGTLKPVK